MDDEDEDEVEIPPSVRDVSVQNQLEWAREYRAWHKYESKILKPKHSPINVPFLLCRAEQLDKSKKRSAKAKPKTRLAQLTMLDRNALTQKEYMELLSAPHQSNAACLKKSKKRKNTCKIEACPPRLIQMAVPIKRRVFATWTDFQHLLQPDAIVRFNMILQGADQALEPRDARQYFKKMAKIEAKAKRKKQKRKRHIKKEFSSKWYDIEADRLAGVLCEFVSKEPLFALNYNQMMLSNTIVKYFHLKKKRVPSRTTKNVRHQTLIEFADKVAKWLDDVNRFVTVQPLNDAELRIVMASAPSLEDFLEEQEEEEDTEREAEEESERQGGSEVEEFGETTISDGEASDVISNTILNLSHTLQADLLNTAYFGEDNTYDNFDRDFGDDLERLIKILSNSDDEFLDSPVNIPYLPPGTTYRVVLEDLKALRDGNLDVSIDTRNPLELMMHDWAMRSEPESMDAALEAQIRETSALLKEYFSMAQPPPKSLDTIVELPEETSDEAAGGNAAEQINKTGVEPDVTGTGSKGFIAPIIDEIVETAEDAAEKEIAELDRKAAEESGNVTDSSLIKENVDANEETGITKTSGLTSSEGEGESSDGEEGRKGMGKEGGEEEGEEGISAEKREVDENNDNERDLARALEEEAKITSTESAAGEEGVGGEEAGKTNIEETELGEGAEESLEDLTKAMMKRSLEKIPAVDEEFPGPDTAGLDDLINIIRGHRPSMVYDHSPNTICCLSLKIWAVWLLEITMNAHKWTKWITAIIRQVKNYASIIRGDVLLPDGSKKVLRKKEWRRFSRDAEEKIIAWRQYSSHVKELSQEIVQTFHGKTVACCPKCLQDHMIKNVVTAHETLQALTEAIGCTSYWQRCLDKLMETTADIDLLSHDQSFEAESESSISIFEIEELCNCAKKRVRFKIQSPESGSSDVDEIEEVELCQCRP